MKTIEKSYALGDVLVNNKLRSTAILKYVNADMALLEFSDGTSAWFLWRHVVRDFTKQTVQ